MLLCWFRDEFLYIVLAGRKEKEGEGRRGCVISDAVFISHDRGIAKEGRGGERRGLRILQLTAREENRGQDTGGEAD